MNLSKAIVLILWVYLTYTVSISVINFMFVSGIPILNIIVRFNVIFFSHGTNRSSKIPSINDSPLHHWTEMRRTFLLYRHCSKGSQDSRNLSIVIIRETEKIKQSGNNVAIKRKKERKRERRKQWARSKMKKTMLEIFHLPQLQLL